MRRDDLYITVPSLFRCPISLDVMKSPVSLCTGVTYDRASIQRWLDSGNNTCPATMQVLQSKEFVPNRTLQRLIQIWSDSVARRQLDAESAAGNLSVVPSQEQVKVLVKQLDNNCYSSLEKIVSFAKESEENREFLATMDGFLDTVFDFMRNADSDIKLIEQVVKILDLILSKVSEKKPLLESSCLSTILLVLQRGSLDSQIQSVRVLESIAAVDGESKLKLAEKEGLLTELVKSISKDKDPGLIEASLSCLIAITMPKRVKTKLIQFRTIPELKNLISEPNTSVSTIEKSLKLLETLSSCKEGRAEIWHDSVLLQAVVQKVLKVSSKATEHAVTILWVVCYLFRDEKAQEAVVSSNGMTKFLLLMQSNCSPAVRQMSADLLKIFRVNSKSCLSSYDTKTTHIMPF
ncbi:hypothetical protein COLO4_14001 [Corchorus olitorius]|uniref:U-box domain-containing protein n=1 Tax=Corchorus olitorius TaxID=93759 RepID=A0A1R3JU48_9ROSI|nr:hypothetical protein COLO4_14001 [Corchorus olitorius]